MERKALQKIVFFTLTALLISNYAFAHDEIKSQALEGTTADNAIVINHGCEASEKPIILQSVVFPVNNPVLSATDSHGNPVKSPANLAEVIEQGSIAGLVDLIQSKDIFTVQKEKVDALGNLSGFYGKAGSLAVNLQGRVPFAFTAPNFVTTSCVKSLNIQVAIADVCDLSKPTIQAEKVNLWIPYNGSQHAALGAAAGVDGVGEPTVLQVNRDTRKGHNPLPRGCHGGIDATVTPSPADVDANLRVPGHWSK